MLIYNDKKDYVLFGYVGEVIEEFNGMQILEIARKYNFDMSLETEDVVSIATRQTAWMQVNNNDKNNEDDKWFVIIRN